MALLALVSDWVESRAAGTVRVVTVDHGLRAEAKAEAALVVDWCRGGGIRHDLLTLGPLPGTGNVPASLRDARYDLLSAWAAEHGIAAVLLGHTLDDQAETVLMRLARGSGVDGLAAMAEARKAHGVRWCRPLLGVRRSELRAWLQARDIPWADDPTNEDTRFDRVRMRQALDTLAALGISREQLAETATRLRSQQRVLNGAADDLAHAALTWGTFGEARLSRPALANALDDTRQRLYARVLQQIGGQPYRPRQRALAGHLADMLGPAPRAATLAGCLALPDVATETLLVTREPAAVAAPVTLSGPTVWDGRWQVTGPDGAWVGILGEDGLAVLKSAAEIGDWRPPSAWLAARRQVLLSVPAIFEPGPPTRSVLLAVPSACYFTHVRPDTPRAEAHLVQRR